MELFLGVDGGQSATKAAVGGADGRILGRGVGGPCNHAKQGEGRERLERGLRAAVGAALEPLGVSLDTVRFRAACLGMSGGPDDKHEIIAGLIRAVQLEVTTDAHIALYGAVEGPGTVVISGTGSIALGRDAAGTVHRAGGWGYVFGDEGSGFDIVRQALRAALRFEEGWGPETALLPELLARSGAASANDLLHRCYTDEFPRDRVAAWAPLVHDAAANGDAEAIRLLHAAAHQLARLALRVRDRLDAPQSAVSYVGGTFRSSFVLGAFATEIKARSGGRVAAPESPPEAGALRRALELARYSDQSVL